MESEGRQLQSKVFALVEATKILASSVDLEEALRSIVRLAARISEAPIVRLFLLDETGERLCCRVGRGIPPDDEISVPIRVGESFAGEVAATGCPLGVPDCRTDRRIRSAELLERRGIVSYLGLPVIFQKRLLGVLTFNTRAPRAYDPPEVDLLMAFADQAAVAIERARLHRLESRRTEEIRALLTTLRFVLSEQTLRPVLEKIVEEAGRISGSSHVKLMLLDRERGVLTVGALRGTAMLPGDCLPVGVGYSGLIALRGEPLFRTNTSEDPGNVLAAQDRELGIQTYLGLPVGIHAELLGVLSLNTTTPKTYTEEEMRYLTSFADQAALAIEHARMHEAMDRQLEELERRVQARTIRLEEALKVKAEFIAKMSHEFRTPLNFLLGYTQLLRRRIGGELTDKQSRFVERVYLAGKQLLDLVEDLLDLSLLEAGRQRLRLERIALAPLIHAVLELYGVQAAQKDLRVDVRQAENLELVADRGKLVQILSNLIGNAVKFTPAGGTITLRTRQASWRADPPGMPAPGERSLPLFPREEGIEISVADSGIGLAAEDLDRIFLGFVQVDHAEESPPAGAGIGLAVVRTLVNLHGGRVWAESGGLGRGARFLIRLPTLQAGPSARILCVSADDSLCGSCAHLLRQAEYLVEQADTKEAALRMTAEVRPDLVLLDIRGDPAHEAEFVRQVRSTATPSPRLLGIVLGDSVHVERALALEVDEFIHDPVDPALLTEAVRRVLGSPRRPPRHGNWGHRASEGNRP